MKTEDIKKLLELYYEGVCSMAEESILIEYFSGDYIDPELMDEKLIFDGLHSKDNIPVDPNLEVKLNYLIDSLAQSEEMEKIQVAKRKGNLRIIYWTSGIAASLALLLSVGILYNSPKHDQSSQIVLRDTYTDPDIAYAEAEKTLMLISSKLNAGLSGIDAFQKGIDKSNEIIDKNLKQINNK